MDISVAYSRHFIKHNSEYDDMKWNGKTIYYTIKDEFELSERHMAYYYGFGGLIIGFFIGLIL